MRRGALLAAALLLIAACDDGAEGGVSPTTEAPATTEARETTTTTAAPDPFTVPADPADIDEAYVEAVLRELEHINGDALRLAVTEGLSPQITELLTSIFEPSLAGDQLEVLLQSAEAGFTSTRRPPGDAAVDVLEVLEAGADCVSADVSFDFTPVAENGSSAVRIRVELRPQAAGMPTNATPWVYFVRDALAGTQELPAPCAL